METLRRDGGRRDVLREVADVHTHDLAAPAGRAVISLPREALWEPESFSLREGALYSAGVHPWWTEESDAARRLLRGAEHWARHRQVVAVGECGIDVLRGGCVEFQTELLRKQLLFAEKNEKDVILHVVRAWAPLLALRKELRPGVRWIVHGFRGKPQLAQQLLDAGFCLSFGARYNAAAYALTPEDRRFRETDAAEVP